MVSKTGCTFIDVGCGFYSQAIKTGDDSVRDPPGLCVRNTWSIALLNVADGLEEKVRRPKC